MESPKIPRPLRLEAIGDELWKLIEEYWYYVGDPDDEDLIKVPIGFETDLTSTPRFLWTFYPRDGKYRYAAVIHDFLYHMQTRTRAETDLIFWEALKEIGINAFHRNVLYNGVRLGGWFWWNKRAKELKNNG